MIFFYHRHHHHKPKRAITLRAASLALFLFALFDPGAAGPSQAPQRIVSLSPNTTEILFELGLGPGVVGVTRYCDYPAQAASIRKVGGFMDPAYEQIVTLRPDLVVLLDSHKDAIAELEKLRIHCLAVPHRTITDIHRSIELIGKACGAENRAAALVKALRSREKKVCSSVRGLPQQRVMVCIGRDRDTGTMAGIYIAGRNNFYDEIIGLAGGVNACVDTATAYPQLSAEGVISTDPDVIIDLVADTGDKGDSEIARQWRSLSAVKAVRHGRVHVVRGTQALRPGPRYVLFLEDLALLLHPGAFVRRQHHE